AGGGTAGHINPALAIAQEILKNEPDAQILFIGNENSMEETLVKKAGFDIRFIKIQGFNRRQLHKNFTTLKLLFSAIRKAERILKDFAPDMVVGTGGYVSGPVLFAATRMGLHTCIHEQNAFPGMTTKILSKRVERVFTSFEESHKFFKTPEKLMLVGNPLRQEFSVSDREESRKELGLGAEDFYVLSFGGSLGATALNRTVTEELKMTKESGAFVRCHAMGKLGKDWMPAELEKAGIPIGKTTGRFRVMDFIYDMPRQIAAADVVIARAGAITIGELTAQKKAAILIPSPNVTNNHQYHNANALAVNGAAVMIEEKDLTARCLYETLLELKNDAVRRAALSEAAGKMALVNASAEIYAEIKRLIG
ncbi:MAG: undecaprenyldiphospho-muramoylpentapeptide beta-N-acetylglucosaminyltransferase, partial [Clostridia bacterium]|nr:undecaprenyldiphospho-muramoylpentapeptide beta-N-acetylglucosaminyltransferase [Clostridia bacterium]